MGNQGSFYDIIIPDLSGLKILLLPNKEGYSLPRFERAEPAAWSAIKHINNTVKDRFAIDVTVLRCVNTEAARLNSQTTTTYAVEVHTRHWQPPHGSLWVGRHELSGIRLTDEKQRVVLQEWFRWLNDTTHLDTRPAWYRFGWFDRAASWTNAQLTRVGAQATGPLEQIRTTERGEILRVETNRGLVHFKAVPPMFAHEPKVMRFLRRHFPKNIPRIIGEDQENHWFLMTEAGERTLEGSKDISEWTEAVRIYSRIQVAMVEHVDTLMKMGCPDRSPGKIVEDVDGLVADTQMLRPDDTRASFSADEMAELRRLAPELKDICLRLGEYRVPNTLEHGDLWAAQIFRKDSNLVFADWSDCSISHPFFSLFLYVVTDDPDWFLRDQTDACPMIRDAYLEPWTVYEPMDRLREIFRLAGSIAELHFALLYQRIFLPNMENRWEWHRKLPEHLRRLLPSSVS